jgi:hypothetical protein
MSSDVHVPAVVRKGQEAITSNIYRRRRLRLGALLYQLQYFADIDHRDGEGEISLYRRDPRHTVEIAGSAVRLVNDTGAEVLELEAAITRCKEALVGQPLHRGPGDTA